MLFKTTWCLSSLIIDKTTDNSNTIGLAMRQACQLEMALALPPYLPFVIAGPKRQRQVLLPASTASTAVPIAVVINTLAQQLRLSQRFQHHNLRISIKYRILMHFRAAVYFTFTIFGSLLNVCFVVFLLLLKFGN